MSYQGDIRLGDTIDVKFCTVSTTGAPTTLAGSPVISAYVGNGTTEITAGITLTVDFDSRTGMHNVRVVATSGNGFATATNVQLVVTTGTVGGTSVVGYVVGEFSIENRSAVMPTTVARTLTVDASGRVDLGLWIGVAPNALQSGQVQALTNLIRANTAQAGAATTITLDAGASAVTDFHKGNMITLLSGTGTGQTRVITAYNGSTKVATIGAAWATNPDNTTVFAVLGLRSALLGSDGEVLISTDTQDLSASLSVNAKNIGGTAQTAGDIAARLPAALTAGGHMKADALAINAVSTSPVTTIKAVQGLTTADTIATYTGNTVQTGDNFARLGAPAGVSVSADIAAAKVDTAAIKTKTDSLTFTVAGQADSNVIDWKGAAAPAMTGDAFARLGVAGVGLTNLGDTRVAHLDADVSSRSTYAGGDTSGTTTLLARLTALRAGYLDSLSAGAVALEASVQALIATVGAAAAGVATAVWGAATRTVSAATNITSTGGTTVPQTGDTYAMANGSNGFAAIKTAADAVKTTTDRFVFTIANKVDSSIQNAASFAQAAADLVWGTAARTLTAFGFTVATNSDSNVTAIKAKTDNLPSDPADESLIIAATDAIVAAIAALNNLSQGNVRAAVGLASANLDTQLAALTAYVDTEVAAIKTKTDNLPASPANETTLASLVTTVGVAGLGLSAVPDLAGVTTLLARLTALRAGYLDNLNALKIKKSTALSKFPFLMVLASDHITPATGKTVAATRSLDGGAFAPCANSVTEVGNGVYFISLAISDLNGDTVVLKFTEAACDQRTIVIATQP